MSFSQKAKELREYSGLSQKGLSEKIGISAAAIGFLELNENEPKGATVKAYAKYFNVTADYLLGLEDDFGARTATSTTPMGEGLTSEERELLRLFRELSPYLKGMTLNAVRSWAKDDGDSERKKV